MLTKNELFTLSDNDWTIRVKKSIATPTPRVILAVHGWTGDENSMGIFFQRLNPDFTVLAPRSPYATNEGGFGWVSVKDQGLNCFEDFISAVKKLKDKIPNWLKLINHGPVEKIDLIGFSQGAALAYVYAILFPEQVSQVACLASYLPQNSENYFDQEKLTKVRFFIAHGTFDEIVPIGLAKRAVKLLTEAKADVTFCEDAIGHKISATCFSGLDKFFMEDLTGLGLK